MKTMSKESHSDSKSWQDRFGPKGLLCSWLNGQLLLSGGQIKRSAEPTRDRWNFYLPDFFLKDPQPWWTPDWVSQKDGLTWPKPLTDRIKTSWEVEKHQNFLAQLAQAKRLMEAGVLEKVVPVVLAQSDWSPSRSELMGLVAHLGEKSSSQLFSYGFWNRFEGMLGLTPEVLFQVKGGQLKTMALAGTRQSGFPAGELLNDPKERHEHEVVIHDIVARLSPLGHLKKVEVGPTHEWCIGSLTHLRTEIHVAEGDWEFSKLVQALHPTPALGAYPRLQGGQWLQEHRHPEAGRFGAPFGVRAPNGDSLCLVAIRNIQWRGGKSLLATGCGVVKESQADQEWQELNLKRQFVLENLGL